jgi:hypothetical protein
MLAIVMTAAPFLLGAIGLFSLFKAAQNFRQYRKASYFTVRRDSIRAAWRWLFILILALIAIAIVLRVQKSALLTVLTTDLASRVTLTPTLGLLAMPTATLDPSLTPKDPLSGPPTTTPTRPAPTPSPTQFIVTAQSSVTPSAGARLEITAIAAAISADLMPVNPGRRLPAGSTRVYIFIAHEDLRNGVSWSQALIYNGRVIRASTERWSWGDEDGQGYYYFEAPAGWPAGSYEVQLYIGDRLAASQTYELGG